ncbi:MAG: DivIVA domain-containing protein [Actinomycetota bacterium]|nr:DivIVA domain-containing protein [Actinomycetota bacterium]
MPDQHAAATEHELITTIAEPLGQLPDDPLSVISVEFPIALRGYDRFAVDAYVERMAELVAELQATRSPEAAVRRALERVGEEISGILQRAHDTADEITARSRAEAEDRLEAARREAIELTAAADLQVKGLDAETERIWAERHSIVTDAQELARRLTELAESAMERFPAAPPSEELPDPVLTVEGEAPGPDHPFDGAVEALDPLAEDEPTMEQTTEDHPALNADHPNTDQPTVDMPPIEPWEGETGPFHVGEA